MATDPWVERMLHPSQGAVYAVEAAAILVIVCGGRFYRR